MKLRIFNLSASYHSGYSAYEGKTIKPTVNHTQDYILGSLGLEKGHLWLTLFLPCPGSYPATQQLSALGPFQCRGSHWGLHFGMAQGAFITSQAPPLPEVLIQSFWMGVQVLFLFLKKGFIYLFIYL